MALSDSRRSRRPKSALRPLPSLRRVSPVYPHHLSDVPCPIPRWTATGASAGYLPVARGLPRSSRGSASTTSLSTPAQASLALRPAGLLSRPCTPDAGRRRWRCSDAFGVRTCRYRPVILPVPAENENLDVFGRAFDDEIVVAKQPRCHARKRSLVSAGDRTIECGGCMVVQIEPGAQCGKNIFKRSPVGFQAQGIRAAFNRHAGVHRYRNAASQAHKYEDRSEPSGSATMWRDHDLNFHVFGLGAGTERAPACAAATTTRDNNNKTCDSWHAPFAGSSQVHPQKRD